MRTRTSEWFEVKVRYAKTMENGTQKSVTELYVVDAMTFTEAEARIVDELKALISGDYKVIAVSRAPYGKIAFDDKSGSYFRVKVLFITLDEKTGTEKTSKAMYLVEGENTDAVARNVEGMFDGTMLEYRIGSISDTKVMDVYEHE